MVEQFMRIQMSERFKSRYKFNDPDEDFLDDIQKLTSMHAKVEDIVELMYYVFTKHQ